MQTGQHNNKVDCSSLPRSLTNQKFVADETHFHQEVNNTTPLTTQMDKVSSILEYL